MGYGAGEEAINVARRALYGLAFSGAVLYLGLLTKQWALMVFQMIMTFGVSLMFGSFSLGSNPIPAASEEAVIAIVSTILLPFMIQEDKND